MGGMKMIVGLGNPGDEYADTRHNTGFKVIDLLAESLGIDVRKKKFGARFGMGELAGEKLILLKPWQFMNLSGQAVSTTMGFYKLSVSNLLVVTDDMDLQTGRIRLRSKGSAGGHNGLADVIDKLGTNEFARCRVGIGHGSDEEAVDYVLDKPSETERPLLVGAIDRARDAVLCWIEFGIETAMNKFNNYDE
jgi:PTH1 family peptidyl-tRNA hydrolase